MREYSITKDELKFISDNLLAVDRISKVTNQRPCFYIEADDNIRTTIVVCMYYIKVSIKRFNMSNLNVKCRFTYEKIAGAGHSISGYEAYMHVIKRIKELGGDINVLKRENDDTELVKPHIYLKSSYKKGQILEFNQAFFYIDINSAYSTGHCKVSKEFDIVIKEIYEKKKTATGVARQKHKDMLNKLNGYLSTVKGLKWIYNLAVSTANQIMIDMITKLEGEYGCSILRTCVDSMIIFDKEHKLYNMAINNRDELYEILNIGPALGQFKLEGLYDTFVAHGPNNMVCTSSTDKVYKHSGVKSEGVEGKVLKKIFIRDGFDIYKYSNIKFKYYKTEVR